MARYARTQDSLGKALAVLILLTIVIAGLWEIGALGGLTPSLLSRPSVIIGALGTLVSAPVFWSHVALSFARVCTGLFVGGSIGYLIGSWCAMFPLAERVAFLVVGVCRALPSAALLLFCVVLFGIYELPKVLFLIWVSFVYHFFFGLYGARQLLYDENHPYHEVLLVAEMETSTRFQLFSYMVLPLALPNLFTALFLSTSSAWAYLVLVESVGSFRGIGYLFFSAYQNVEISNMFASMCIITSATISMWGCIALARTWVLRRLGV